MDEDKEKQLEEELEQLRPLKDTLVQAQKEFQAKEESLNKKITELEQQVNPNWKQAREQIEMLKKIAIEKGVELDANGNPIQKQEIDINKIKEEAEKTTKATLLNARLDELLDGYDSQEAQVIRSTYRKLTNGEEVTMQNIRNFVDQSVRAAGYGLNSKPRIPNITGAGPRFEEKPDSELSEDQVKEFQRLMNNPHIKTKIDK